MAKHVDPIAVVALLLIVVGAYALYVYFNPREEAFHYSRGYPRYEESQASQIHETPSDDPLIHRGMPTEAKYVTHAANRAAMEKCMFIPECLHSNGRRITMKDGREGVCYNSGIACPADW